MQVQSHMRAADLRVLHHHRVIYAWSWIGMSPVVKGGQGPSWAANDGLAIAATAWISGLPYRPGSSPPAVAVAALACAAVCIIWRCERTWKNTITTTKAIVTHRP